MLTVEAQRPTYIIMDALDECPITSTGIPSPREDILDFVDELVGLHITNLHICVTSRPAHDIQTVLEHLSLTRLCHFMTKVDNRRIYPTMSHSFVHSRPKDAEMAGGGQESG
jgi:hypothetical protein